ncbi:thioesterase family protein [Thiotrichales bacterium 19S11-10]|nr:thioesterase family protein [Thiotrichales bacterium 19S11-10]
MTDHKNNTSKAHETLMLLGVDQVNNKKNTFLGHTRSVGSGRLYGGMEMGQALNAAASTVLDKAFYLHSFHCYFIRPGIEKLPVTYQVKNIRDGNFFANRWVEAYQSERLIFTLQASFHKEELTPIHEQSIKISPRDNTLKKWQEIGLEYKEIIPEEAHHFFHRQWPFDIYPVNGERLFSLKSERASQDFWLKLNENLDLKHLEHQLLFTYISDLMLLQIAGLPTEFKLWQRKAMYSSLDQCVWFHQKIDVTKWLYFVVNSDSYRDARGIVSGKLYDENGKPVATVIQEGLIRPYLM